MLTENGIEVDMNAVREVLQNADVLTLGFPIFPERLLVDTRFNDDAGPLVAVVPPASSVQERYLWLGQHRGQFGLPKNFSFFVWPHSIRGLEERDALRPLRERLATISSDAVAELDKAVRRLEELERQALAHAIVGADGWGTIWSRTGSPR